MIGSEHERRRQDGEPDREGVGKPASPLPESKRDADREAMDRIERFPLSNTPCRNEQRSRGSGPGNWRLSSGREAGAASAAIREHAAASESSMENASLSRKSNAPVIQWNESAISNRFAWLGCKMPALHGFARASRFRPASFCVRDCRSSTEARQVATC